MHKRWKQIAAGAVLTGTAALVLSGLGSRAQNQSLSALPHYVWLEREAVIAQPPQVIADSLVHFARWSPDGRHVLALRSDVGVKPDVLLEGPNTAEMSVVLWNSTARRAFSVWKHAGIPAGMTPKGALLAWLPGSQVALLPINWTEQSVQTDAAGAQKIVVTHHQANLLIDAARERVEELPLPAEMEPQISPATPQVLLHNPKENTVRIMDKSGAMGQAIVLPQKENGVSVEWMPDGSALLLSWSEKAADTNKPVLKRARLDLATHDVTPLDKAPQAAPEAKPIPSSMYSGPLHVRQMMQALRLGESMRRTRPLWLESDIKSERMQTLLCADANEGRISPRGDAALYISQGAAWVAPLVRAPREAFTFALRALVMRNAKQSALAVLMYAQDYDEVYPSAGDRLGDAIAPYLQNGEITEGLNYSYAGGAIGDIKNPATTILGTYAGPGGVAVIYADGHVKWKDN